MSKILVTSALPYINGVPHLGHMVGCLLPSDIYARFMRMMGHDVLYIAGTDEHGTASEVGALNEGMEIQAYCDMYHEKHKKAYNAFNLSFDCFGRTSSEQTKEITYHIFSKLDENGYIKEKSTKQIYSIDDDMFLADRYITGTCPYCGYDKARGDQCEKCTKVLEPTDLKDARSTISGSKNLEVRETKHLFIDLPKLQPKLEEWVKTKEPFWPDMAYSIAQKWLKEGLQERGITRDLKWGFPVNKPGYEDKVFYVWFDAPIGYVGITKQWADANGKNWKDWWMNPKEVRHVEFMGKDNVPYHSIIFPAMLLGTNEPWTQVDFLKSMSYLNFEGGKFSKSEKRGVFADQAADEFAADYWRYWLMSNIPEASDTSFSFESFAAVINKDLNGVLGNFVSRVLKMTSSKLGDKVPEALPFTGLEKDMLAGLDAKIKDYIKHMENMEFRKALNELRAIWVDGNNYITAAEPWTVIKTDEKKAGSALNVCINLIRVFAVLSYPIMPETALKMLSKFGIKEVPALKDFDINKEISALKPGQAFEVGEMLFEKIAPEKVIDLKQKYGGGNV